MNYSDKKTGRRSSATPEQKLRIVELYANHSAREVAEITGLSYDCVRYTVERLKLTHSAETRSLLSRKAANIAWSRWDGCPRGRTTGEDRVDLLLKAYGEDRVLKHNELVRRLALYSGKSEWTAKQWIDKAKKRGDIGRCAGGYVLLRLRRAEAASPTASPVNACSPAANAAPVAAKHKNAVCYFTRNGKVDETQTFVLANDNHRKEFLSLCVAIAQGEAEAERITIQYND